MARHLAAQIGKMHEVLVEGPRLGRTAQFTEVIFATDQPEGKYRVHSDHRQRRTPVAGLNRRIVSPGCKVGNNSTTSGPSSGAAFRAAII